MSIEAIAVRLTKLAPYVNTPLADFYQIPYLDRRNAKDVLEFNLFQSVYRQATGTYFDLDLFCEVNEFELLKDIRELCPPTLCERL